MPDSVSARPVVLVVDDEEDDIFFLRRALAPETGYSVRTFTDSALALAYLKTMVDEGSPLPHALLSDIRMPGLNGFELVEKVRAQPKMAAMRIAMVSGSDLSDDVKRAKESGANAYFVKFPNREQLLGFIEADLLRGGGERWLATDKKIIL